MERAAWLAERRRVAVIRFDTLFAATYDEEWGYINETHRRQLEAFLARCPSRARVLDAACGTGKYWPLLLQHGVELTAIDQSGEMLRRAQAKSPDVRCAQVGLQEMAFAGEFDAIICMDALENVAPEDWPRVLANFARALRPHGLLYFTVELLGEDEIRAAYDEERAQGLPVVAGEDVRNGGYHYYPSLDQVRTWTREAGFTILAETEGDGYFHVQTQRIS